MFPESTAAEVSYILKVLTAFPKCETLNETHLNQLS